MSTSSFQASTDRTSTSGRTIIIGIGMFGLQVVSLLLSRLEVYYRFAKDSNPNQRLITRLGLIDIVNQAPSVTVIERSSAAFAHSKSLQRLILDAELSLNPLQQHRDILSLLDLNQWTTAYSWELWLRQLLIPILTDEWNHRLDFVNAQLYIVATGADLLALPVFDWIDTIQKLHPAIHINFVISEGQTTTDAAEILTWLGNPRLKKPLIRSYLLQQTKINYALVANPGELALIACNFLDTIICSDLGNHLVEQRLPDEAEYLNREVYSSIGAAKLYIPIAEVSSDILERVARQYIATHLNSKDPAPEISGQILTDASEFKLDTQIRMALMDLPITIKARHQPIIWRFLNRLHRSGIIRQPINQAPYLRLNRQYWKQFERNYNQEVSVAGWWQALTQFETLLFETELGTWLNTAGSRLGLSLADEQAVNQLNDYEEDFTQQALRINSLGSATDKAIALAHWINTKLPILLVDQSKLVSGLLQTFLTKIQIQGLEPMPTLTTWLGKWLWRDRIRKGFLYQLMTGYRRSVSYGIAEDPRYLGNLSRRLEQLPQTWNELRQQLDLWQRTYDIKKYQPLQQTSSANQKLGRAKKRLIQAMQTQPYPIAVMARLWIIWIVPLIIGTFGLVHNHFQLPPTVQGQLTSFVIGWTLVQISLFILIQGSAKLRIRWWKMQIETQIFRNLDQVIESQVYATTLTTPQALIKQVNAQTLPSISLMTAYLQVLERELTAPEPTDPSQPASLRATVIGATNRLQRQIMDQAQSIPQSLAYQPIGEDYIRTLLAGYLEYQIDQQSGIWVFQPQQLTTQLGSAEQLSNYLWKTLQAAIVDNFVETVRYHEMIRLPAMLESRDYEHIAIQSIIDDLQMRSRPLVTKPLFGARQLFSDPITYISLHTDSSKSFFRRIIKNQHIYYNATVDPFGMGLITVIDGISPSI